MPSQKGMFSCPKCKSVSIVKNGMGHTDVQHYRCNECRYTFSINITNTAKTLIFDIENAPCTGYFWNTKAWNTNIPPSHLIEDWFMLTWAAKWLNSPKVYAYKLTSKEAKARDDKRIVRALWSLFEEADIIVAHNAWGFDIPMANTKFIIHDLGSPSPYRVIDTLRVAKKVGKFTYNSLNYLAQAMGLGKKIDTDFQLWPDCRDGKTKALKEMSEYNVQDTFLLEEVYLRLRGWTPSHPNLNLYQLENGCSHCGSMRIKYAGDYPTNVNKYKSYRCSDCGGFTKETKRSMASTAR